MFDIVLFLNQIHIILKLKIKHSSLVNLNITIEEHKYIMKWTMVIFYVITNKLQTYLLSQT